MMRGGVFRCRAGNVQTAIRSAEEAGGNWVRFGNDLFIYSANAKWPALGQRMADRDVSVVGGELKARQSDTYLVVQKGRTFQLEYPEVPVLFDKGRYLIVEIGRDTARSMGRREEPCFRIEPLPENSVVFEDRPPPVTRREPNARLSNLVDSVDLASFQSEITHLVSHPTRYSTSTHYADAANWAASRLTGLGYNTALESITLGAAGTSSNVVADKTGSGSAPRQQVIVTGHLDSVNLSGGPSASAPGADDNASGATGVLEIARVMSGLDFVHDLAFILFGGEEQGLHGSEQYVAGLSPADRNRVVAVINMDMIGTINTPAPTVLLEGAAVSQLIIDRLTHAAITYTGLAVQTSLNPFASDHVPFIDAGLPAVLTIEGADGANDAIHTANDTLDGVDSGFALEILKMNIAAVAELAELRDEGYPLPNGGPPKGAFVDYEAELLRALSGQYQLLFAQYLRLHREGRLQASDYAMWQSARWVLDSMADGRTPGTTS